MKPLSTRTTPRRLMVPISRHFLPVLQPEPPAWLTTGLMKGSRRPFALYLLSGTTDCSAAASSPAPLLAMLPASAGASPLASSVRTAVGFGSALGTSTNAPPRRARSLLFAPAGLAPARREDDFTGVATLTPLDLAGTCVA